MIEPHTRYEKNTKKTPEFRLPIYGETIDPIGYLTKLSKLINQTSYAKLN